MKANQRKVGVILSYVSEFIKILSGLIYTPIMLRLLGQNEYGLYQLVYSFVSYLGLLSLGFGSAYMRFYSRYKAADQKEEIARLNGMFMSIFCVISCVCILCGSIMLMNIHSILGDRLTDSEYETAKVLMALLVLNLAITFPSSVYNCNITAHEKFLFQKLLIVLQNLFSPFLTLPLLIWGYGSIGVVSVTTFLTISVFISNAVFCHKRLCIKFLFRGFKFSLLKEMWAFTFFIFLSQIIDQVNWSVDKFLLGRLIGTTAVAIYGVGGQLNVLYIQFSTSISNVFIPKVNQIVSETKDDNELTRLFIRVGRVQFMLILLLLSGFYIFGKAFIYFWAGTGYEETYFVALLLMTFVTIPLIQNLGIEIQKAKNMHRARSIVYFFIAIANIFISIPLIGRFGPVGAAAGTALALMCGNTLFMNWYYHKKIRLNIIAFWSSISSFIPALIIPAVFGIFIHVFVNFSSFSVLAIWVVLYTLSYCISMWFFGMNNEEKKMIREPIRRVFR